MSAPIRSYWLGRVGYREAVRVQESLRARVWAGDDAESLLLLEHDPVITLGRGADRGNILVPEAELRARGVDVVETSRGGDVTWHGPGQLVAYPIVRLHRGVVFHVEAMARAVVEIVRPLGIEARFRRDCPGVWVGDDKLCAFGVHVSRRVAIHGLALNVTSGPADFAAIVPCGLRCSGVTSIAAHAAPPPLAEVAAAFSRAFAAALDRPIVDGRDASALLSHAPSIE